MAHFNGADHQDTLPAPLYWNQQSVSVPPMRMENFLNGDSQINPNPNVYQPSALDDSQFEPSIAILQMSLQWERLISKERTRSRTLSSMNTNLQMRLRDYEAASAMKDAKIKNLEEENLRMHREIVRNGKELQELQDMQQDYAIQRELIRTGEELQSPQDVESTPTTLSDYRSIDFPAPIMLPPLQSMPPPAKSKTPASKRKNVSPVNPEFSKKKTPATHKTTKPPSSNISPVTPSPMDALKLWT
ncbi:hypothetical protein G7Y89_g10779 [Cudoniella acicularis]|uniref:Uncharacterized protein n=1 Tax=Cudoniella acicularis TaxID=354080 RepID=A0A8H4REX9_9HELO|nr:hypothetical protein G7Y89_g10779 [Cudoniella acicularis]